MLILYVLWRTSLQCTMRPDLIVERQVPYHSLLGLTDGVLGVEIDLLLFETPPPPLDKDIVSPPPGSIHADPNVMVVQEPRKLLAGELTPLSYLSSMTAFDQANRGWINAGRNLIIVKSPPVTTNSATTFSVTVQPRVPVTSVNFVCDKGVTVPGESASITGSLAQLGAWDPQHAIKLDPSVYYEYIWNPPTTGTDHGHGPSAPVWTGVATELPTDESFEWKCVRIRHDGEGTAQIHWQPGANNTYQTTASGYAGRTYGSF